MQWTASPRSLIIAALLGAIAMMSLARADEPAATKPAAAAPGTPGTPAPATAAPQKADEAIRAMLDGLADDRPQVIWDSLPAAYQKDINNIIRKFATKMDPELFGKWVAVNQKLARIVKEKKAFILAHPRVAAMPAIGKELEKHYEDLNAVLELITTGDHMDLGKLKNADLGAMIGKTGRGLMLRATALSAKTPEDAWNKVFKPAIRNIKVELVEGQGDAATLRIAGPDGQVQVKDFVRVQGKWVMQEIADSWAFLIENANTQLDTMDQQVAKVKPQAIGALAMAEAYMDNILNTKTQEEFNVLVDVLIGLAENAAGQARPAGAPRERKPAEPKKPAEGRG